MEAKPVLIGIGMGLICAYFGIKQALESMETDVKASDIVQALVNKLLISKKEE